METVGRTMAVRYAQKYDSSNGTSRSRPIQTAGEPDVKVDRSRLFFHRQLVTCYLFDLLCLSILLVNPQSWNYSAKPLKFQQAGWTEADT